MICESLLYALHIHACTQRANSWEVVCEISIKKPFLTVCEEICQLSLEGKSASQSCEILLDYCMQVLSYWKCYSPSGTLLL